MAVEMNFQVAGAEKNLGSLTCMISSTAHPDVEVCRYEAQSAPYDGAPCWFILPPHASFTCTRVGIFYWLSTQVSPLEKSILSPPSAWKSLDVPKPAHPDGSGGSSSWTNQGSADVWVSLSLANPGFDAEFANCAVGYVHMCSFVSLFGRVNASSCGFVVGAGETLACNSSPGIKLLSATAFPLTTNIVPSVGDGRSQGQLWHNISCPFATPLANNCPCSHNGSDTQDSLISLKLSSPTAGDNSIWCYSSQSEDLCSLSWNSGAQDSASCVFFLPATETLSCKIQFGTILVEQAVEMPLNARIFAPSPSPPLPGWERRVGDGVGRGPLTSHTDVPDRVIEAAWADFKREYQRTFVVEGDVGEEEMLRKRNFAHSLRQIRQLELLEPDAQFGATEFSDWSTEEWLQFASGLKQPVVQKNSADAMDRNSHALFDPSGLKSFELQPSDVDGVDWRERGAVTPVKNQGTCGNCWAFSSTASTEAAWAIAGNELVSLSEEFLTDCNYPQSPGGCKGGFPQQAFKFMIKNGIDTESSYNYTAGKSGKASNCTRHWPPTSPVRIEDFINIPSHEDAMQAFATERGPFAVGLDAAGPAWKQYVGGVLRSCCNHAQEHAPTVVGWGTEREGQHIGGKYWVVRNSWGPTWGERGYIRLEMGSNQCGITQSPSAPCVCKGCNTSCAKPAPLPPIPPPIPPPPPPPAKEQTCKMAGGQGYTCPLDNPVCCSVQFGNTSKPATSHYCCNGPSPVCCKVCVLTSYCLRTDPLD